MSDEPSTRTTWIRQRRVFAFRDLLPGLLHRRDDDHDDDDDVRRWADAEVIGGKKRSVHHHAGARTPQKGLSRAESLGVSSEISALTVLGTSAGWSWRTRRWSVVEGAPDQTGKRATRQGVGGDSRVPFPGQWYGMCVRWRLGSRRGWATAGHM
nr:hypothetical protein CFP56_58202 [Quercus suber]